MLVTGQVCVVHVEVLSDEARSKMYCLIDAVCMERILLVCQAVVHLLGSLRISHIEDLFNLCMILNQLDVRNSVISAMV